MQHYGTGNLVKAAAEETAAYLKLVHSDNALRVLPPDTKFAIILEAITKGANESFIENDTVTTPLSISWVQTSQGVAGRFLGYLSFSDTKVRIYQVMDVGAAALGQDSTNIVDDGLQAQLLLEDDLSNLTFRSERGGFVLANAAQKFELLNCYKISNSEGHFESAAAGMDKGFAPTFKFLAAHGVDTSAAKASGIWTWVFLIIFVAICAVVILFGHRT